MASFTETATLKVIDQSTRNVRKINKELANLRREAKKTETSLRKMKGFKINLGNIDAATRKLAAFGRVAAKTSQATAINPRVSLAGLTSITRRLEEIERRAKRTRGALAGLGNNTGRVNVPGGGVGTGGVGRVGIEISPLKTMLHGFIYRLGYTIENSIVTGFREGTKNVDVSETRNRILGYTPEQLRAVDAASSQLATDNPTFTRSDFRTLFAELGPILGADPTRATPLVEMAANYGNILLGMGKDAEQAFSGIRSVFKALDNINRLQDDTGGISPDAMKYFEVIMRETIRSGSDITPEKINTAAIYARTFGKTMTPQGFATLIQQLEAMGRVAGSSMNRFVETLSGTATKKAIRNQEQWGLITTEEIDSGSVGGKRKREVVRKGTLDEELLREDPNAWVVKNLIPRLKERGADLNNPAQVAGMLAPLFSSVVAKDMALNLATWQSEFEKAMEASRNVIVDPERIREDVLGKSSTVAVNSVIRQATELMGEIGQSVATSMIPALQSLRDILLNISGLVRESDSPLATSAAVTGVAGVAGVAAYKGFGALADIFGLKGSAVALNASAAQLTRAAIMLQGGAAADIPLSGGDGGPKKRGGMRRLVKGAAIATAVTTAAVVADEVLLDGAGSKKIGEVSDATTGKVLPVLEAILEVTRQNLIEKPMAEGSFDWKKFLLGDAADPNFNFRDHMGIELKGAATEAALALGTEVTEGSIQMQSAFTTGASLVGTTIQATAGEFGSTAGAGLLAVAAIFGQQAAAAFQAAAGSINVNVKTGSGPDTGTNRNEVR